MAGEGKLQRRAPASLQIDPGEAVRSCADPIPLLSPLVLPAPQQPAPEQGAEVPDQKKPGREEEPAAGGMSGGGARADSTAAAAKQPAGWQHPAEPAAESTSSPPHSLLQAQCMLASHAQQR